MDRPRPSSDSPANRIAYAAVFAMLVAIGALGRWGQPDWCVTPMAAVGLLAGYALPLGWAVAAPVAAMLLTDLALPAYQNAVIAAAVYGAMAFPPLLGRLLRRHAPSPGTGLARLAATAAAPSVVFFVTTNLAVWATTSLYTKTPVGLLECYAAAVPFLRRMAAGDFAYTALVFGAAAIAGAYSLRGVSGGTASPRVAA